MKNKKILFKTAVIAAVLSSGLYIGATMEERVVSALKEVGTVRMSRTAFRKSVSARGSLYSKNGEWFAAAGVDESDISEVRAGQEVDISGAAFDGTISGTVAEISNSARSEGGRTLVDITVRLNGECEGLRSGYTVQCGIYVDKARLLCTLPYEVIRQDDEGEYVYVCDGHKAVRRGIETGVELSGETEIISGISEQSEVIASPDEVTPGALIRKGKTE